MELGGCDWGGGCEDVEEGRGWELCHLERSWWSQEYGDSDSLQDWVGNSTFLFQNMVHDTFPYLHTPSYVRWFHFHILFVVQKITCPIVLAHLEPLKEDNLSIKDRTAEFMLSPTCPLLGDSTVFIHLLLSMHIPIQFAPSESS